MSEEMVCVKCGKEIGDMQPFFKTSEGPVHVECKGPSGQILEPEGS